MGSIPERSIPPAARVAGVMACLFLVGLVSAPAQTATSASYRVEPGALDGGGRRVGAGTLSHSGSLTGLGGAMAAAGSRVRLRTGWLGQLNEPPAAADGRLDVPSGGLVDVVLTGRDPDRDPLSYRIVRGPSHGVLSGVPPRLLYRPNPRFVGTDDFRFRVTDGTGAAGEGTWTLVVAARPNREPSAVAATYTLAEDQPLSVWLQAEDPDGDVLTYEIVEAPTRGVLTGTPPALVYQPNADVWGVDEFRYRVRDPGGLTATAVVRLEVLPVNDPPRVAVTSRTEVSTEAGEARIPFVLSDPDSALAGVVFHLTSARPEWVRDADLAVTGDGALRTLVVRWTPGIGGTVRLGIAARDAEGASVSVGTDLVLRGAPERPFLVREPVDLEVDAGAEARFQVEAGGAPPLHYEWLKDGVLLAGANRSELVFARTSPSDAGAYSVRVSNAAGSVVSRAAVLRVRALEPRFEGRVTAGGMLLRWILPPGTYAIDGSEDLKTWFFLGRQEAPLGQLEFLDPAQRETRHRFYRLRTGPDSAVRPRLAGGRVTEGFRLRSAVEAGTYRLEASDNLVTWTPLARVTSPGGEFIYLDPAPGLPTTRVYRLVRE